MALEHSNDDDSQQHNQRFSDFAVEPRRMLMPIQGYEKKPLVTLEEAVEPIVEYVPDVKRMAYIAKMNCNRPPADNLSLDESASIMLYSMDWEPKEECLYHVINATLRSENRRKLVPWFLFLKLLLTALSRLPSKHLFVYRGIKRDMRQEYSMEATIIWWGFSSCTSTIGVLENQQFLGTTGTRTLFTIECTNGKDIRRHSYFRKENEILLLPGRQFQVVSSLNQSGGLYMIQLKEIEPPYPLLQPISEVNQSAVSGTPQTILKPIETDDKTKPNESQNPIPSPTYTNDKLLRIINQKKNESWIFLNGLNLTSEDMEIVNYYLLRNNTRLTHLGLESNQIGDEGIQHLSNGLENNHTVSYLKLSNNRIGNQGMQYLSNGLESNQALKELYLANNQIGDKGMQYLSNVLQNNKTLTKLGLSNNKITDNGIQYLSNGLQNNQTLTALDFSNNQIGDQGSQYLSNVLEHNQTLTYLDLSNNQIGDKGRQFLQKLNKNKTHLKIQF